MGSIDPTLAAIERTAEALLNRPSSHWIVAFSGGKDSTASLKILLAARRRSGLSQLRATVIYCDTGVENPVLDAYVKSTFRRLQVELEGLGPNLQTKILRSPVQDRFFVKIVGRGYPPPTNSFRWCTNGLRIRPVSAYIQRQDPTDTVVVLGLRRNESNQRDRTLAESVNDGGYWQKQREGNSNYDLYLPILNLSVAEVWDSIFWLDTPRSVEASTLERLYSDASGECPVLRAPTAPPCASGRFGCWTCTVVRKDRSAMKLIEAGHDTLEPFLEFRNWLADLRNDANARWPTKRNGREGLGPFTMEARREILRRIDLLEARTRTEILDSAERGAIAGLWRLDDLPRVSFKV